MVGAILHPSCNTFLCKCILRFNKISLFLQFCVRNYLEFVLLMTLHFCMLLHLHGIHKPFYFRLFPVNLASTSCFNFFSFISQIYYCFTYPHTQQRSLCPFQNVIHLLSSYIRRQSETRWRGVMMFAMKVEIGGTRSQDLQPVDVVSPSWWISDEEQSLCVKVYTVMLIISRVLRCQKLYD